MPWSETYSFTVEETTPQFATPPFEVLLKNLPKDYPRIYCFLNGHLADARKKVRTHPEFEVMVDDARTALAMDFSTDTQPYKHVFAMSENFDKLNTAYQMLQYDVYADKMMANVRCFLSKNRLRTLSTMISRQESWSICWQLLMRIFMSALRSKSISR